MIMYKEIELLDIEDKNEILRLLNFSKHQLLELEDMWMIMDIVWDEIGCNNKILDKTKISKFYSHPVWVLNGIFIENHNDSLNNRHIISNYIKKNDNFRKILDFGGGWGTLARIIANDNPEKTIDIYDEYPNKYAIEKCLEYKNINFIKNLSYKYDCIISTDVLEHVEDPLKTFDKMITSLKKNGVLIIGNNFYPVIKCHLPSTFHFRYTFKYFAKLMGLVKIGNLNYTVIYRKIHNKNQNWFFLRFFELLSKLLFPVFQNIHPLLVKFKRIFK